MRKKILIVIIFICLIMICISLLSACVPADAKTENAVIDYGESARFSQEETQSAMDIVLIEFLENYKGCDLQKLWYDEKESYPLTQMGYQYEYENIAVIILFSDFTTGNVTWNSGLNSNDTYTGWKWYLTREESRCGEWKLVKWGSEDKQ